MYTAIIGEKPHDWEEKKKKFIFINKKDKRTNINLVGNQFGLDTFMTKLGMSCLVDNTKFLIPKWGTFVFVFVVCFFNVDLNDSWASRIMEYSSFCIRNYLIICLKLQHFCYHLYLLFSIVIYIFFYYY